MGRKYDYFDEQSDQIKQDQRQIERQMEQIAREQARDSLKRMRQVSKTMADLAEKEALTGSGAAAGGAGAAATGGGAAATTGAGGGAATAVGGAGSTGVGAGATGGVAIGWKVILILLIVVLVIVILYFLISAIIRLSRELRQVQENPVPISDIDQGDRTVNNAEYVLRLMEEGYISLETSEVGAFDDDYARQVLEAVAEEQESRGDHINVSYEGIPWILVEDANGRTLADLRREIRERGDTPPDYYEDSSGETYTNAFGTWQESTLDPIQLHIVLSRRDIETTHFTADYFADPYELRWQPVYVLCAMRVSGVAGAWGLSETDEDGNPVALSVDRMAEGDVGDYFLKEEDITECINCFKPNFRYTWNPLEEDLDGAEFTFDDVRMRAYLERDGRESPTSLGGRAYVYHIPSVAASSVDLGYRRIEFNIEEINGEYQITSRTIYETPEEWLVRLNQAAGGYFSEARFLYLLAKLPGTEDMVEEYRAIFAAEDSRRADYTVDGCVGAFLRNSSINPFVPGGDGEVTGLNIQYMPAGESVILEMRNCYINQGDSRWGNAPRGDGTYTIRQAGCIDCCFAMCSHYFNGSCIPMELVSTQYIVGGQAFHYGNFCSDFHLGFRTRSATPFPLEEVKGHLRNGNLVIMQIRGRWVSETGRTLHGSTHTHYIVIYGYDDEGLYLCDPGNASNSTSAPVSYTDIMNVPLVNNTFITSQNPGFVPKFAVNTLRGGRFGN